MKKKQKMIMRISLGSAMLVSLMVSPIVLSCQSKNASDDRNQSEDGNNTLEEKVLKKISDYVPHRAKKFYPRIPSSRHDDKRYHSLLRISIIFDKEHDKKYWKKYFAETKNLKREDGFIWFWYRKSQNELFKHKYNYYMLYDFAHDRELKSLTDGWNKEYKNKVWTQYDADSWRYWLKKYQNSNWKKDDPELVWFKFVVSIIQVGKHIEKKNIVKLVAWRLKNANYNWKYLDEYTN